MRPGLSVRAPGSIRWNASAVICCSPSDRDTMNDAAANHQLVQFHNVSYSLPNLTTPILSDLNLSVARGETFVLLGESGCGKTTTLKLVNRLLVPTGGEVV